MKVSSGTRITPMLYCYTLCGHLSLDFALTIIIFLRGSPNQALKSRACSSLPYCVKSPAWIKTSPVGSCKSRWSLWVSWWQKLSKAKQKRNSRERISGNNTSVYQQNSCHFALKIVNPNIHAAMSDQLSSVESRWYILLEDHGRCCSLMHTTCHSQWHRWRGSNGFLFSSLAGMEWKYNLSWFPVSMSMFQGVMKGFSQIWFGNGAHCARPTWPNVYIYIYSQIYTWLI